MQDRENSYKWKLMKSVNINNGPGISLQSFIQIIEMDAATCTVSVQSGGRESGSLFFAEGKLVDAECGDRNGLDAAYILCACEAASFSVGPAVKRPVRIDVPLSNILLNAAVQADEKKETSATITLQELINYLDTTQSIGLYLLLNKQGKVVLQSGKEKQAEAEQEVNRHIGFITYCVVLLTNIAATRKYTLEHFSVTLDNGKAVMAVFYQNMVLGLLLDHPDDAENVASFITTGKI
jgi:hypothetical protein